MEDDYYADAVLNCYAIITEHLKYDDIVGQLISGFILTVQEKQDLDALQIGPTSRACRLLDLILSKKRNIGGFVEVLKQKDPTLGKTVEEQRAKISSGEILPNIAVTQQFQSIYDTEEWTLVEKLPGESFTLDITDDSQLMPLDVIAEVVDKALLKRQMGKLKQAKLIYKYESQTIPCVEEILSDDYAPSDEERALENQFPSRLFLCTGIAGTGKTVTLKRMAWQWAKKVNKYLKDFNLVIVIPLSKVNREQRLLDLLGPSGLKYFDESQKDTIHKCLKQYGNKVLFALDGADEVDIPFDSELCQLISGKLYPDAKVFIMSRPDSKNLSRIEDCKPDVKIHIKGTNKEGIYNHILATIMKRGKPHKEDADLIIMQCNRLLFSFDLLYIPMYLSIITILFDQHWVQYASFSQFHIPKTITTLFNNFMCVIIKLWLKRIDPNNASLEFKIELSPTERSSGIPVTICAKLVNMGRMSFESLLKQKYYFTECDLQDYLVDVADVLDCGMLKCSAAHNKERVFTFHHQIFQQYLSAVYLNHMKLKDAVFRDHCQNVADGKSETLEEFFSPLQLCMRFLFGMAPNFGADILRAVLPCVKIGINTKERADGTKIRALDLVYEAELCSENEELVAIFKEKINEMGRKEKPYDLSEFAANFGSLHKFLPSLSVPTIQNLLKEIYNLYIIQDTKNIELYHFINPTSDDKGSLSTVKISNMDVACFSLISRFTFPSVTDINIDESMILDVKPMATVFPNLCHMKVRGRQEQDINLNLGEPGVNDGKELKGKLQQTCLKYVHYKGDVKTSKLPKRATMNLFNMTGLQTLEVSKTDILSFLPTSNNVNLTSLQKLILSKVYIKEHTAKLCSLLGNLPTLSSFELRNPNGDTCDSAQCEKLMTVLRALPKLDTLALVHTFDKDGVITMCEHIEKFFDDLKRLEVGEWDVLDAKQNLMSLATNKLETLDVRLWYLSKPGLSKVTGPAGAKVFPLLDTQISMEPALEFLEK